MLTEVLRYEVFVGDSVRLCSFVDIVLEPNIS